jgi:hypothetical protein
VADLRAWVAALCKALNMSVDELMGTDEALAHTITGPKGGDQ